jgi:predicted metal-dependent hydrolase
MSTTNENVEFRNRVRAWACRIRVSPRQIRVQRMTRKWASCSTSGWISFADDLLDMPTAFQDYVIVHELLHIKLRNHGRVFRSLLSSFVPGWQRYHDACVPDESHSVSVCM